MKSLKEIKKELHEYIDSIDDEKKLIVLYENTLKYLKSDSQKVEMDENDLMSDNQKKRLDETIDQVHSDETQIEKESRKSLARWFSDGGKNSF